MDLHYLTRGQSPLSGPQHVQGMPEYGSAFGPRISLPPSNGNRPDVVLGIEHPNDGLDMLHLFGQAFGVFLVVELPASDIGVKRQKVGERRGDWGGDGKPLAWRSPPGKP
jgi:hypothetical protein